MDKNWFTETVKTSSGDFLIPEIFQLFSDDMSANLFVRDVAEETGDEPDDYVSENPKIYEHIDNFEVLEARMLMYMNHMNEVLQGSSMDLVFFKDCLLHLVIISIYYEYPV
ncbi:dynein heavy chain 8, axonemal-like isoform X2 [Sipha flava]|nr:dynein heavy chain 8, axonemal-like isoform X2 [Sipha flava]